MTTHTAPAAPIHSLVRPEQAPGAAELFFSSSGRLARLPFLAGEGAVLGLLWLYDRWVQGPLRLATGWATLFVLLFAGCCLVTRRLHDLGRAGWWTALPFALFLFAWPEPLGWGGRVLRAIVAVIAVWLAAAPGEPRANRFGPSLGGGAQAGGLASDTGPNTR